MSSNPTEIPRIMNQFTINLTEEDVWSTYRSTFTKTWTLPRRKDILHVAIMKQTSPLCGFLHIQVAPDTITVLDNNGVQFAAYRPTADCRNRFLNWLMADPEDSTIYTPTGIELELKEMMADCVPQSFTFQLTEKAIGVEVQPSRQSSDPVEEPEPPRHPYPSQVNLTILPEDLERSMAVVRETEAKGEVVKRNRFCALYHAVCRQFPEWDTQYAEVGYVSFRLVVASGLDLRYRAEEDKRFYLEPLTRLSTQDYNDQNRVDALRALLPLTVAFHLVDKKQEAPKANTCCPAGEPGPQGDPYPPSIRLEITKEDVSNAFFLMGAACKADITNGDILCHAAVRQHGGLGKTVRSTYAGLLIDGKVGYVADDASLPAVLLCTSIDAAQYKAMGVLFHHLIAATPFSVTLHQPSSGVNTEKGKQVLINTVSYARSKGIKGNA